MADVTPYINRITSRNQTPKFLAWLAFCIQPLVDNQATMLAMPALFDLDLAAGDQLDIDGKWIGQSRNLQVALPNVYFSFGMSGLGWSQAVWKQPDDPVSGLVSLPDEPYRTLLRAKIGDNHWDGSIPDAYTFLDPVFPGGHVWIQDHGDRSMSVGISGAALDAVTTALLTGGYLSVKPAGVRIRSYITPSVAGGPVFGFGVDNQYISGFGTGAWGQVA